MTNIATKRACGGAIALVLCVLVGQARVAAAGPWVSGFYAGWMSSAYPPSAIDFSSLTHVMVFSAVPQTNGTLDTTLFIDAVNGPLVAQDIARRAHAAGKKAILTVGGADTEVGFKGATAAANMATFVQNIVGIVKAWGFDGVDIDWEPLPASDDAALLSLVSNLRNANPEMTITADVGWLNANFALSSTDAQFYAQLGTAVDQMNMMTYGMADNWGGWVSWHSSAIYGDGGDHPSSVSSSARMYLAAGVPASKLGIGIGFYGACWNAPTTAPLQTLGTSNVVASDNTMSFANIKNQYYSASHYAYDSTAAAPYLWSLTPTGPAGCTFISYEDETSVAAKAQYVQLAGLGGAIIWQLAEGYNPSASDPNSLLHAVGQAFLGTPVSAGLIEPIGGSGQSTIEGTPFQTPLQARVLDGYGNPVAGVAVTFTAPATGASLTFAGSVSATVVTNTSGIATAPPATANTRPGSYKVSVIAANGSVGTTFSLTNTIALPLTVTATGGTPQSAQVNKAFSRRLQATVTDKYGNPVSSVAMIFSAPSTGASATFGGSPTATSVTNASGVATSPSVTANGLVGTYTVVAAPPGGTPVASFSLTNTRKRR